MTVLRLLGVLLLMGLVAPAGWLATAQPATAEEGGGEGESGDAGSDDAEATEDEDEATVRARQAAQSQPPAPAPTSGRALGGAIP